MAEPVASGPGALARRTDRGPAQKIRELPDAQYGEAATYRDLQQQAPLSQQPAPAPAPRRPARGGAHGGPVPFTAPTQRPNEPVTHGADSGPGAGSSVLGLQSPAVGQWATVKDMVDSLAATNPDDSAIAYLAARLQGRF